MSRKTKPTFTKLKKKAYRDAYLESYLSNMVGFQVKAMRQARGWSQQKLAARMQTSQSVITRLESGDHIPSGRTLLKLASVFDVALFVGFVSFTKFMVETSDLSPKRLAVKPFAEQPPAPRAPGDEG